MRRNALDPAHRIQELTPSIWAALAASALPIAVGLNGRLRIAAVS
jgi:hypothetical protein